MTASHRALDALHQRYGDAANIRIIYESVNGRGGEVQVAVDSAIAQSAESMRTLPHYDDCDLALHLSIDDELRVSAMAE